MKDDGFKLPTPEAEDALECATSLLEWCGAGPANRARMSSFCDKLVGHLKRCFPEGFTNKPEDRGEMWRNFISFRISRDRFLLWNDFLMRSVWKGGPVLFQYITNFMFKELAKLKYPIPTQPPPHAPGGSEVRLTHDENGDHVVHDWVHTQKPVPGNCQICLPQQEDTEDVFNGCN